MLKVALVGVGEISHAHIPAWLEMKGCELVALCDIRPAQMDEYENVNKYIDFDEMLEKEKIDILDICLPTYMHVEFAIKAMKKGINVITEKPVSLKKDDVKKVYGCAKENNVRFMVAHVIRFWPEYLYVKYLYDSKKYGKLLSGTFRRLSAYPSWTWDNWMHDEKRCGLVPFDLHIHDIDFLVYTFGIPKKTYSFRSKQPDQDYVNSVYDFGDFYIQAEASWFASPYHFTADFRVQFENAIVELKGGKLILNERGADNGHRDTVVDLSKAEATAPFTEHNPYYNELRYFADCVEAGRNCDIVKAEELESVIEILNNL